MQKPVLLLFLVLLAAVCFAQGDHVPAYNHGPFEARGGHSQFFPRTSCGEKPSNILTKFAPTSWRRKFPMC